MPLSPINEKNKAILVKALKNHNMIWTISEEV
jgi:hypothetical protein